MKDREKSLFHKYCYLNGKIIELKDAKVSVTDIGVLRGFGVFDFLKVKDGKMLLIDRHLERLNNSIEKTNLKLPVSRGEIIKIIDKLLEKNKVADAGVRIVLTGGESVDGMTYNPSKPTIFILLQELHQYPDKIYQNGVKLITFEHQRELPEAKTNNYITKMKLQGEKEKAGAFEILYVYKGHVLEGATSNFFIFKNDTLITAKKDDILLGTRRGLVLELAREKFEIEERKINIEELRQANEAFIVSTTPNIVPVVQIDGQKIGDGKVGANTKYLMERLGNYLSK